MNDKKRGKCVGCVMAWHLRWPLHYTEGGAGKDQSKQRWKRLPVSVGFLAGVGNSCQEKVKFYCEN